MSGITQALRTAQSGLRTNQAALDVTANNIANVNSPGYSRKIVRQEQRVVEGAGAGVQIADIVRQVDEGLLKSLRLELSSLHTLDVQETYYDRMQEMFGTPEGNSTISHIINELTSTLEVMAVSSDRTLEQSELVRWGRELTLKLQSMSTTIQELRVQADSEITEIVTEINRLVAKIGDYNDKIIRSEATGIEVTDLKDQRDAAVDKLAQFVDIRYFFRADGDVVVFTSGGRTIVDNIPATLTHDAASSVASTTTHAEGDFAGIFVGTTIAGNDITNEIRSGRLKGLIDLRDGILPNLQSQIDELSAEIRDVFNQIHNRGTSFPGIQSLTGTRNFIEPTSQKVLISGTGDTRVILFDGSGNQAASVSLKTLMEDANFGGDTTYNAGAGYATGDYWIVSEMATNIQNWLNDSPLVGGGSITGAGLGLSGNTVSTTSGKLVININSTSYYLAFRDENATDIPGSTHTDATIHFDSDSDGDLDPDETVSGFSNFFGLNDFFVDNLADNVHESNVLASGYGAGTAATLSFRDATGSLGTLAVTAGETLATIAANITNNITNVTATVVPDGSGFRLRISHNNGASMTVTQDAGTDTLLDNLGMHVADVRVSTSLSVRSDIATTPGYISRGAAQWDSALGAAGEYFTSIADSTIAVALAEAFTTTNAFDTAGGIANISATFEGYAAAIVSTNATLADTNADNLEFQQILTDSLQHKSDTVRGVNLDEEMAQLILLEQAYIASARIITVIQKMFEALEQIL